MVESAKLWNRLGWMRFKEATPVPNVNLILSYLHIVILLNFISIVWGGNDVTTVSKAAKWLLTQRNSYYQKQSLVVFSDVVTTIKAFAGDLKGKVHCQLAVTTVGPDLSSGTNEYLLSVWGHYALTGVLRGLSRYVNNEIARSPVKLSPVGASAPGRL